MFQNTSARIITKTSRFDHITPVLKDLHWIPVSHRVDFKILVQTYKTLHDQGPKYLNDLLNIYQPTRNLRSKNSNQLVVPKTITVRFCERSFSNAAPKLWNDLPSAIRDSKSVNVFKRSLKTHIFTQIYSD